MNILDAENECQIAKSNWLTRVGKLGENYDNAVKRRALSFDRINELNFEIYFDLHMECIETTVN